MPSEELLSIYHAIFSSHLVYGCQVWGQSINMFTKKVSKLQNRAMRILSFADFYANADPLYKMFNILKLNDIIAFKIFSIINFQSALTHTFNPLVTSIPLTQKALNWAVFTYPFLQLQSMDLILSLVNVLIVGISLQKNSIAIYLQYIEQVDA